MAAVAKEILCRSTVGLQNPYTRSPVRVGDFVLVQPDDPKFGPLIGTYLIPVDKKGRDLPSDRWPGAQQEEDAVAAVAATLPTEDTDTIAPESASVRPQESPGDAQTVSEGEPLPGAS